MFIYVNYPLYYYLIRKLCIKCEWNVHEISESVDFGSGSYVVRDLISDPLLLGHSENLIHTPATN